jgi:transcription initiation factor IIE alpha subunit
LHRDNPADKRIEAGTNIQGVEAVSHQVQDTSLITYYGEVMESIGSRHKEILRVFGENPNMDFTNAELSEELDLPINSITPRVYELRGEDKNVPVDKDNPILMESQRRRCNVTGRTAIAWRMNYDYRRDKYRLWRESN